MLSQPRQLAFDIPELAPKPSFHRVVCYDWGDTRAKETVICVHGLTRNGRDFDFLADALSKNYRVLCPDMPGRGKSAWLPNPALYNYHTYITDILYMLQALQITRVHWVGTSMGGIIGLMLANTRPDLLASLLLNDVGCLIPAAGLKRIMKYAGKQVIFASRAEAEQALRERCAPFGIPDEAHWQHLFTYGIEEASGQFRLTCDPAIGTALPVGEAITDVNLWPFWDKVKPIPVMVVRGETSDILTRETAQEMQTQHPRLTLHEAANTGHAPALMSEEQIGWVRDWLNRMSS